MTTVLQERILIEPPGGADGVEPTVVGFLSDMPIGDEHYFTEQPDDDELDAVLMRFRDDAKPDALVYCGFGLHSQSLNPSLGRIGWAPPKVMNAAIMWAFSSPEWAAALDGWIGIEQTNNDHDVVEKNRNWVPLLDRHERRFEYRRDHTMIALLYDQGRAAAEAIVNAPELTGAGISAGLERIKMMTILEIVPAAKQCISYGIPAFKLEGKAVAGFAAFKNHLSYFPHSGSVLPKLSDDLDHYSTSKGTLQFPIDTPLPKALVKKLIAVRRQQLEIYATTFART